MDPFKGQGGIQMLLIVEQEAQHIVSNARNCLAEGMDAIYGEQERNSRALSKIYPNTNCKHDTSYQARTLTPTPNTT
ncbi:hypothetical protein JHK87_024419 [Glycine soja]|nr:hypothetical protein JHK87_024419 [Glycine soja]